MTEHKRDGAIDALRGAHTLPVVFHHSAIAYGGSGGWFYREIPASFETARRCVASCSGMAACPA